MILEFKKEYSWLSNFEPVEIAIDGVVYPSVEHAYMSAKSENPDWKQFCADSNNTAGEVKKKSYTIEIHSCWDDVKLPIMKDCLRQKFTQEPFLTRLKETGNQNIVEGNYHDDKFWGVCLKSSPNIGENHLGRIIMDIRFDFLP